MYCKYCGNNIPDTARFCPHCGKMVGDNYFDEPIKGEIYSYNPDGNNDSVKSDTSYDTGRFAWAVLGFFFPVLGFILYFVMRRNKPRTSKKLLIGAIVGAAVETVAFFVYVIGAIIGGVAWEYYDKFIDIITAFLP